MEGLLDSVPEHSPQSAELEWLAMPNRKQKEDEPKEEGRERAEREDSNKY